MALAVQAPSRSDLMRPSEFRARLGLGRSRFCELQRAGRFRDLLHEDATARFGHHMYSRTLVLTWLANARSDEPVVVAHRGPRRLSTARGPKAERRSA